MNLLGTIVTIWFPCSECNELAANVLELWEKATLSLRCYWKPAPWTSAQTAYRSL